MSSDDRAGDRDDPGHARLILLPAADTFDGRDHVMSAAAYELHVRATRNAAAGDHPLLVPDEYLSSLTGEVLHSPGADPAVLAAELCAAGGNGDRNDPVRGADRAGSRLRHLHEVRCVSVYFMRPIAMRSPAKGSVRAS